MDDLDIELQELHRDLYTKVLQEAVQAGADLVVKFLGAARADLQARESACRDFRERAVLSDALLQLRAKETDICQRYPEALRQAFQALPPSRKELAPALLTDLQFDQLELMDEAQVQESVVMARAQQAVLLGAEASLAELTPLMCTVQGFRTVRPERNPLRPEVFLNTLKTVLEHMAVPTAIRLSWLAPMGMSLGKELRPLYSYLLSLLQGARVEAAVYAVIPTPLAAGGSNAGLGSAVRAALTSGGAAHVGGVEQAPDAMDALLTLDKLRRLLSGELEAPPALTPMQAFAEQFSREFERAAAMPLPQIADFEATVPAAFEALTEMKQTDRFIAQLERRKVDAKATDANGTPDDVSQVRVALRRRAQGVAQKLSLEVVTLMVDSMARDSRLLPPVQELVRSMEPALLRLALVDPRFFTDKQHPARVLLQEVTHRSLAYPSVEAEGFKEFVADVQEVVAPLVQAELGNAEPFGYVLSEVRNQWTKGAQERALAREKAVAMLQKAEQRNVLAEKMAREIRNHPDAKHVPAVVVDFLCGPWVQVVAQARIAGVEATHAADKYQALISAMLWSTHAELARKNVAKLTRVVPRLIATLREGLETIQFPVVKTSAFLEELMGVHQAIFKAAQAMHSVADVAPTELAALPAVSPQQPDAANPWVAPDEARASNFMELPDALEVAPAAASEVTELLELNSIASLHNSAQSLPLGTWVELNVGGQWLRTQLTWASPHGTLFLFTSATGTTQSMTRRLLERLLSTGALRVISGHAVVDGALDAVAQIAMKNSLDSTR